MRNARSSPARRKNKEEGRMSMPWDINNMPDDVMMMPEGARKMWTEAANAMMAEHPEDEKAAMAAAMAAVKAKYEKGADGAWRAMQQVNDETLEIIMRLGQARDPEGL